MRRGRLLAGGLALALMLGCWIPEQFDARVVIGRDGGYTFTYDGTLTFSPALAAAKGGKLSAREEAELRREGAQLAREPGFRRVEYLGQGRYKVLVEKVGRPGEPYYFLSGESKFFAVVPQKDGTVSVSAIRPNKETIRQLSSIGAKMDGTLAVSVPFGAKVLRHNAQSQPSLFGLLGSYKWQIRSPDEDPLLVVRP